MCFQQRTGPRLGVGAGRHGVDGGEHQAEAGAGVRQRGADGREHRSRLGVGPGGVWRMAGSTRLRLEWGPGSAGGWQEENKGREERASVPQLLLSHSERNNNTTKAALGN